ncbi:hypothetical protein ADUPG1_006523 [Aduncisulcus paluster]|uniref:non-specific serine/threonine protein kinase n=1 Tax=Aduncisulcus paluster TaxID=2918883 RepID=A0ABQ5KIJ2_9EUKA|nr:hypothetical protein ADUPG1_006523 [Aduncisulcus paluster]
MFKQLPSVIQFQSRSSIGNSSISSPSSAISPSNPEVMDYFDGLHSYNSDSMSPRHQPMHHRHSSSISGPISDSYSFSLSDAAFRAQHLLDIHRFNMLSQIGSGSYGTVFKSFDTVMKNYVAIKRLMVTCEAEANTIAKEITFLMAFNHPNIIKCFGLASNPTIHEMYIITEYADAGAVSDVMFSLERPFSEEEALSVVKCVLEALVFCHKQKVLHRDIKGSNVLLTMDGMVKLVDFGIATAVEHTLGKQFSLCGTPLWMAPEVVKGDGSGTAADIWSVGILLIELLEKVPPFSDIHPSRVLMTIARMSTPPTLSDPSKFTPELLDLLHRILQIDPDERNTAQQLLQHSVFKKVTGQEQSILAAMIEQAKKNIDGDSHSASYSEYSSSSSSCHEEVDVGHLKDFPPQSQPKQPSCSARSDQSHDRDREEPKDRSSPIHDGNYQDISSSSSSQSTCIVHAFHNSSLGITNQHDTTIKPVVSSHADIVKDDIVEDDIVEVDNHYTVEQISLISSRKEEQESEDETTEEKDNPRPTSMPTLRPSHSCDHLSVSYDDELDRDVSFLNNVSSYDLGRGSIPTHHSPRSCDIDGNPQNSTNTIPPSPSISPTSRVRAISITEPSSSGTNDIDEALMLTVCSHMQNKMKTIDPTDSSEEEEREERDIHGDLGSFDGDSNCLLKKGMETLGLEGKKRQDSLVEDDPYPKDQYQRNLDSIRSDLLMKTRSLTQIPRLEPIGGSEPIGVESVGVFTPEESNGTSEHLSRKDSNHQMCFADESGDFVHCIDEEDDSELVDCQCSNPHSPSDHSPNQGEDVGDTLEIDPGIAQTVLLSDDERERVDGESSFCRDEATKSACEIIDQIHTNQEPIQLELKERSRQMAAQIHSSYSSSPAFFQRHDSVESYFASRTPQPNKNRSDILASHHRRTCIKTSVTSPCHENPFSSQSSLHSSYPSCRESSSSSNSPVMQITKEQGREEEEDGKGMTVQDNNPLSPNQPNSQHSSGYKTGVPIEMCVNLGDISSGTDTGRIAGLESSSEKLFRINPEDGIEKTLHIVEDSSSKPCNSTDLILQQLQKLGKFMVIRSKEMMSIHEDQSNPSRKYLADVFDGNDPSTTVSTRTSMNSHSGLKTSISSVPSQLSSIHQVHTKFRSFNPPREKSHSMRGDEVYSSVRSKDNMGEFEHSSKTLPSRPPSSIPSSSLIHKVEESTVSPIHRHIEIREEEEDVGSIGNISDSSSTARSCAIISGFRTKPPKKSLQHPQKQTVNQSSKSVIGITHEKGDEEDRVQVLSLLPPTSLTDAALQRCVYERYKKGTVITIAHRLDTVMGYDKILVMDAGRVGEYGSPAELLAQDGLLSALVKETGEENEQKLREMAGLK